MENNLGRLQLFSRVTEYMVFGVPASFSSPAKAHPGRYLFWILSNGRSSDNMWDVCRLFICLFVADPSAMPQKRSLATMGNSFLHHYGEKSCKYTRGN